MAELASGFEIKIRSNFNVVGLFPYIAGILGLENDIMKLKEERKTSLAD